MKIARAFPTILRGVSQQAPSERLPGQHGEQVNLIADPVRGLVRRNGMQLLVTQTATYTAEDIADAQADSHSFRVHSFRINTNDYDLIYRSRAMVGDETDAHLSAVTLVAKYGLPKFLPVSTLPEDTGLADYRTGGISAITNIGRYVLMAGNSVVPTDDREDVWGSVANQQLSATFVNTGAYGRTYTIKIKQQSSGVEHTVSYTTMGASYPGTLVVDDLDPDDENYQKYLNDRIYAYQSAQSKWTADAAADIVPSSIATKLYDLLQTEGSTGWSRVDNYLFNEDTFSIQVTDGFDDRSIRTVHNVVEDVDDLVPRHFKDKVVKLQPKDGAGLYYFMKGTLDDDESAGPGPVTWEETAGVTQKPLTVFSIATVVDEVLYWASTPANLQALFDLNGVDLEAPTFVDSRAGDDTTNMSPDFFNRPINMLAVFQDRLLIASGAVVRMSAIGDYFNFYPSSIVNPKADDAIGVSVVGTEGDVIRKAVTYDRNLTLYGDRFHYVISGRQALDATNPGNAISVQYNILGSGRSQPVGQGQYVFVLKEDSALAATQLLQLQAGVWQDSPGLSNKSEQLRDYINGTPAEMVALSSPSVLFVRTEPIAKSRGAFPVNRDHGFYVYQYLDDAQGQRLSDAWGAWEWHQALGTPVGISDNTQGDGIFLYTVSFIAGTRGLLLQHASARPDPTGMPYIDGMQPSDNLAGLLTTDVMGTLDAVTAVDASYSYVTDSSTQLERWDTIPDYNYTVGDGQPQVVDGFRWSGVWGLHEDYLSAYPSAPADNAWTGLPFAAFVDLTNPAPRAQDNSLSSGELIITKFIVSTTRTGGIKGSWRDHDRQKTSLNYSTGYTRSQDDLSVAVGRNSKHVQVRLSSVLWYPMTITGIKYTGNWYKG